jgi:hypothetical protein
MHVCNTVQSHGEPNTPETGSGHQDSFTSALKVLWTVLSLKQARFFRKQLAKEVLKPCGRTSKNKLSTKLITGADDDFSSR